MKVSKLEGDDLDYWVARCLGLSSVHPKDEHPPIPKYSTDWCQGGPIIEKANITIIRADDELVIGPDGFATNKRIPNWFAETGKWVGYTPVESYESEPMDPTFMISEDEGYYGPTPLVAAMRAYVASKFGDEVPDEEPA